MCTSHQTGNSLDLRERERERERERALICIVFIHCSKLEDKSGSKDRGLQSIQSQNTNENKIAGVINTLVSCIVFTIEQKELNGKSNERSKSKLRPRYSSHV